MEHYTSASIEILGSELRYAEVERDGGQRHLVRLGSCGFDFPLEQAIAKGSEGDWIKTFAHAVRDILAGTPALDLHIALHPPLGYSLFAPIPAGTPKRERLQRIRQDVAVVFPEEENAFSAETMRIEVHREGEEVEWWHVMAIPAQIADTLEKVLNRTEVVKRRFCAGMSGAAAILRYIARDEVEETPVSAPFRLAIGQYEGHTECLLMRNQAWQFGATFRSGTTTDRLYRIRNLLDALSVSPAEVMGVFLYGPEKGGALGEALGVLAGCPVSALDPLSVVTHQVEGLTDGFSAESYAPCIGANLRDVYA